MTTEEQVKIARVGAAYAARRDNGRSEAGEYLGAAWERVSRELARNPGIPASHLAVKSRQGAFDVLRTERGWRNQYALPMQFSQLADDDGDPLDAEAKPVPTRPLTRDESARLWKAVAAILSNRIERMVIELRFRDDVPTDHVAAVFGLSEARVGQLQAAGLAKLRDAAAVFMGFGQ